MEGKPMKLTMSVLVKNHAGILYKVVGLFSRRAYNIHSLAVGTTSNPAISRMTIVVDGDEEIFDQVEKQLCKLIDVIEVKILTEGEFINRELILLKVNATSENRSDLLQITKIFGAKVIDVSHEMLIVEYADTSDQVRRLEQMLERYGIQETVRTGTIAIENAHVMAIKQESLS
ncbi:MAG: acetolactate synthase small subunit [Eubacteriales bacterium]|nr:acetolactate synthase small subunit [Eubacteriales bacterium]